MRTAGPYDSFLNKLEHAAQEQERFDATIEAVTREVLLHYARGRGFIGDTKYTTAVERLRDAHRLALVTADNKIRSQIEVALGGALVFLGSIPEAVELLKSALSALLLSNSVEDQAHIAFAYGNMALAREFQGQFAESRTLIGKAIPILENDGENISTLASMYLFKAQNLLRAGEIDDDVDALLSSFFACLDRIPPVEAAPLLAAAWGVYGNQQLKIWDISKDNSDLEAARTYFGRALAVAEHSKLMDLALLSRHSLAQCVWFEGDNERARALFLEIAADARVSGYLLIELNARHDAAGILLCMENLKDALPEIRFVKNGYEKLGGHPNLDKINHFLSTLDADGQEKV